MKLIKKCVFLLFSIAVLLSCSREDYSSSEGTGKLSFNYIGVNTDVISTIAPSRTSSLEESKPIDDYVKNGFSLNVFSHTEPIMVYQCTDYEEYKAGKCEEVELRSGSYDLITVLGNHTLEGFELPCYSDTLREVKIKNGEETGVTFNCKLSNSLLKINYTYKFKEYFSTYSSSVSTSLGNKVDYTMEEVRSAYLSPGDVTVYVTAKKEGAKEATFNVGTYKLSARYEYALTLDVDASSAKMKITFSDKLTEEPITIDISDEALNASEPRFYSETIVSNEQIAIIEGEVVENPFVVSINAEGLIAKCELTTNSEYLIGKGWPINIDLNSASAEDINKVKSLGLDYKGLGVNSEQMAFLDFTNVIRYLPKETPIEINIKVTDKFGKSSTSDFVVSAKTNDCKFKVSPTNEEVAFLGNECKVNVSFITGIPEDIKFALDDQNPLEIVNMEQKEDTDDLKNYVFTLKAADGTEFKNPFPVNAKYLNYDINSDNLNVGYGVLIDEEGDVWAKKAVLHVYNADMKSVIIQKEEGGSWNDISSIEVSGTDAIVKGLTSNTFYRFRAVKDGKEPTNIVEAKTEEELQIPNSGFEEWHRKNLYSQNVLWAKNTIYGFYFWKENDSENNRWWDTTNTKTTPDPGGSSVWDYRSASGVVPTSDESETASAHLRKHDGQSNLKTEGHNGNAVEIATVGWGSSDTWTSNSSQPSNRTPGCLYIGKYADPINYGRMFESRPNAIKFWYKYYSYNKESTTVYAEFYDKDLNKIGYGEMKIASSVNQFTEGVININYSQMKKASSFTIVFPSTDSQSPSTKSVGGSSGAFSGYLDSRHIGSILTIDDVQLIYE